MLKKISGLCAGAACLTALCGTAFAQTGAIGNAVGGVVDAGEDVANGIINAGDDLVRGVTGGGSGRSGSADGDVGDLTTPDNDANGDTNNGDNGGNNNDNAIGDASDGLITDTDGDGDTAGNPGTGDVTMGFAAISAVLAAMGVTVTSIRRKQD